MCGLSIERNISKAHDDETDHVRVGIGRTVPTFGVVRTGKDIHSPFHKEYIGLISCSYRPKIKFCHLPDE